jgi:hypothetical protein
MSTYRRNDVIHKLWVFPPGVVCPYLATSFFWTFHVEENFQIFFFFRIITAVSLLILTNTLLVCIGKAEKFFEFF